MEENKRLSLCMIVRNEETFIRKSLNSVKDVVDEMIIVDTGSTDDTVKICKSLGATVLHYDWENNFAAARNYGLESAKGDWILWLDADEEVEKEDAAKLRDVLSETKIHIGDIQLINYYGSYPTHPDHAFLINHHRLFRNHMGFRFKNRIHEQLNVQEVIGDVDHCVTLPVRVYHYGYLDNITRQKDKHKRNTYILEMMKQEDNRDPWIDYHLASEYYREQEHTKAFPYINEAILKFIHKQQTPPSLLYKLKYEILVTLKYFDGAWPAIDKAIALYPDYVDLQFYKGLIFLGKEKYKEAIEVFQHCLTLGENNLHHLTLKGVGSFQAWFHIGQCYKKLNQREEATLAFETCLQLSHHHELAMKELEKIKNPFY
ncbi:glycosyltransferase [Shimazuella kribbensis]|uniref:glycosyltransferase n=1 Tax=Shimazuella kribbensis TaxID=139808 RepID=UPI00041A89AA|nr:glycosyltransferase [Shimazuella kribbensis]